MVEPAEILSNVLVLAMALLTLLHIHMTKSNVKLGFTKLMEKCWRKKHVPTQREMDQKDRLDNELLKIRLQIFGLVPRLAVHPALVVVLGSMHKLMQDPSQLSLMQLVGPAAGYSVHSLIQSGVIEIKSDFHLSCVKACFGVSYAFHLLSAAREADFATFCAMEKILGVSMTFLSVLFIDVKMTLPLYISGAVVLNYKQWKLLDLDMTPMLMSSAMVSHIAAVGVVAFVVYAMRSYIAAKVDSDQTTSLLLAFRKVLRGACDGDLVLDSRTFSIVGDASSLERLLKADKKLADTNFMDLFLDTDSRQQFEQFLNSETQSPLHSTGIPPCLRISLQGADGPVSVDAFCTSCAAAGQDCYLLALKADQDQFLAPPDAVDELKAPWQMPEWTDPVPPGGRAESEVVEAFKELVQVAMLVNNDTPSMDVEEVTLSFMRSRNNIGMPTLRSFIRLKDWDRVQGAFQHLSNRHQAAPDDADEEEEGLSRGQKSLRFAHPLLFRIPGSRSRSYLCANDVEVNVAEQDSRKDGGAIRSFWVNLNSFDSRHIRHPKEHDLKSISEE